MSMEEFEEIQIEPLDFNPGGGSVTVVDNLESTSATSALSAKQGNVLKGLIDNIPSGAKGDDGDSAYQVWLEAGNEGTVSEYLSSLKGEPGTPGTPGDDGINGRSPEYQFSATHLQYRLVGDSSWTDLIPITSLKGATGATGNDGKSVELQKTATYIQWRLVGEASWNNLVALADIKGEPGAGGIQGEPGADGSDGKSAFQIWLDAGNTGDESVFLTSLKGATGNDGIQGEPGADGNDGSDGRTAQFFQQADEPTGGTYYSGDMWLQPD